MSRIALFGQAGSTAQVWKPHLEHLDDAGFAVERPGRATRRQDTAPAAARDLILDQADQVLAALGSHESVTLIGHSFGGALAYFVAVELHSRHVSVEGLVISAAPYVGATYSNPAVGLDDEQLAASVISTGGAPAAVMQHHLIRNIFLGYLRKDYAWKSELQYLPKSVLDVPVRVVIAVDDDFVAPGTSEKWSVILPQTKEIVIEGDHFAAVRDPDAIRHVLKDLSS